MAMTGRYIGRSWRKYDRGSLLFRLLSTQRLFPALSVSLLLLAGCATESPSGPTIASSAPLTPPAQGSDTPVTTTALPGVVSGLAALLPEPPRPDNMSLAPQAGPAAPELVGMTAQQLGGLLGQPRYLRRETPAQVWQYADRRCILDIFLYPDQGEYRVVHVETRDPRSLSALNVGSCLNGLAVLPVSLRGS